jgi:hypothetical protein
MTDQLFDTQEKKAEAILAFQALLTNPGWKLYCKILEANASVFRKNLEEGVEGETKEQIDNRRQLLKYTRELLSYPERMIWTFQHPAESTDPDLDPYDTKETIIAARKGA